MDRQRIFDTVASHLLRQRGRCASVCGTELTCRYRGDVTREDPETGRTKVVSRGTGMCAIGCLIPDRLYDREWEGMGVQSLYGLVNIRGSVEMFFGEVLELDDNDNDDMELLCRLQSIHDSTPVERWAQSLEDLARLWSLRPLGGPSAPDEQLGEPGARP